MSSLKPLPKNEIFPQNQIPLLGFLKRSPIERMGVRENLVIAIIVATIIPGFFAYINPYVAIVSLTSGAPDFWVRSLYIHIWPFVFIGVFLFLALCDYIMG